MAVCGNGNGSAAGPSVCGAGPVFSTWLILPIGYEPTDDSPRTGQTWKLDRSSVIPFITFHQSSILRLILGAVLRDGVALMAMIAPEIYTAPGSRYDQRSNSAINHDRWNGCIMQYCNLHELAAAGMQWIPSSTFNPCSFCSILHVDSVRPPVPEADNPCFLGRDGPVGP